jgi:hypothetical protein
VPHQIKRPIQIVGDIAHVPLTQGYTAVIDAEDVKLVEKYNWHSWVAKRKDGSVKKVYAVRNVDYGNKRILLQMHKVLFTVPEGYEVDHENGNGLDCRKCNLRKATHQQNSSNQKLSIANKTGYKGVVWNPDHKKYTASIGNKGKKLHLGSFSSKEEAAKAYADASYKLHGKFGRLG